ncbi:hypothetical protein [Streptomyces platensis]|uniref:hypothetical protein n=1 Tax=Streptomyces platensis TaxID=58346 RepID=UPI0036B9F05D
MTTIDVETTEPSDSPAPPGPLNQAITADQTVGPTALADFVRQAMAELPAIAGADVSRLAAGPATSRSSSTSCAADVRAAAPPGTLAGPDITADATGLTLSATVRRADEPG